MGKGIPCGSQVRVLAGMGMGQDVSTFQSPPIPAGLAGVLQESCRNPEDSAKLCQLGRAWQDWDRVQQDSC